MMRKEIPVETVPAAPGEEVRSSVLFKADAPRDSADHIRIPSPESLFDEDAIQVEWGSKKSFSQHMRTLRTDNLPRSIVTENEWLHIAQERYIERKTPPDEQIALLVELGRRTYTKGLMHDEADRLKTRGKDALVKSVGEEKAGEIIKELQPQQPEKPKTFASEPKRLRGRHRPKR